MSNSCLLSQLLSFKFDGLKIAVNNGNLVQLNQHIDY